MSESFLILYDYLMTPRDIAGYNTLFLKTAREHIQALESLLSSSSLPDIKEIFRHVHSLKGSSQMMGYQEITKLCSEIIANIRPQGTILTANKELVTSLSLLVKELENQIKKVSEKMGDIAA